MGAEILTTCQGRRPERGGRGFLENRVPAQNDPVDNHHFPPQMAQSLLCSVAPAGSCAMGAMGSFMGGCGCMGGCPAPMGSMAMGGVPTQGCQSGMPGGMGNMGNMGAMGNMGNMGTMGNMGMAGMGNMGMGSMGMGGMGGMGMAGGGMGTVPDA